ncbi:MSP domain protein [Ancylostoma caninum]|uniref:Major sperm protein n=1 Tax=Ancylostoma caninum TaxID=29170 RepID=A0A368GQB2_ANCCA|nr:MSP domain protein [Ancylostoma caninum]
MSNRSESSTAGSGASEASRRTQAGQSTPILLRFTVPHRDLKSAEPQDAILSGAGSSAQAPVVPNMGGASIRHSTLAFQVTFFPNEKRQQTYVVLSNNSDRKVMFKMKSTRPGVYKMKPVFGVVNPGEKYSIRVTYMGIKVGHRIPLNDRITVVLAAVTSKAGEAEKEATESEMKKRKLYILYKGVNDQVDPEAGGDVEKVKPAVDKKQEAKLAADQKAYMEGYDEGYKAAIIESRDPKASDNPAEALERLQKSKGIVSFRFVTKSLDGTNVTAFTPGGTDPSLGDPLKRQDIVHIGPTGKKQIVIIMYRDVALPEKLLSRSGDEDEDDDDVKSDLPQPPQPN